MESYSILRSARAIHVHARVALSGGCAEPPGALHSAGLRLSNRSRYARLSRAGDSVRVRLLFHAQPLVGTGRGVGVYLLLTVLLFGPCDRSRPRKRLPALAAAGADEVWRRTAQCRAHAHSAGAGGCLGSGNQPRIRTYLCSGAAAGGRHADELGGGAGPGHLLPHAAAHSGRFVQVDGLSRGPGLRGGRGGIRAFLLLVVFEVFRLAMRAPIARLRFFAVYAALAIFLSGWGQIRKYCTQGFSGRRPARADSTIEYRIAERLAALHPQGRVFASGGLRFRLN